MRDNVNTTDLDYRNGFWQTRQTAKKTDLKGAPAGSEPTTSGSGRTLDQVLPVQGQGTVSLDFTPTDTFSILLSEKPNPGEADPTISLTVSMKGAQFAGRSLLSEANFPDMRITPGERIPYWFSLDKENRRLRYGRGYMAERWCVFEYVWREGDKRMDFVDTVKHITVTGDISEAEWSGMVVDVWPLPVVRDRSPYICDRDSFTLEMIEDDLATVVEDLTEGCQILYANVAGDAITLTPPDFPEFADAIAYSINTPGLACYEMLKKKAAEEEFGDADPNATYLRVTVGPNLGTSPGVPFVLEIWPAGHYSPIHNHAQADAIIKVLHGSLTANIYPFLTDDEMNTFRPIELRQGDVTWLTPGQQQTHQLYNHNPAPFYCATIQCYRYPDTDTIHYEYFDFINPETLEIEPFKPNSDWTYGEFKKIIREEWDNRTRT